MTSSSRRYPIDQVVEPKLEALRWFVLCVELGSAQAASKKLKMGNTAIIPNSNRKMESILQVKLFDSYRKPTPDGMVLYKHAKKVLAAHRKLLREMKKLGNAHKVRPQVAVHVERWLSIVTPNLSDLLSDKYQITKVVCYDSFSDWLATRARPGHDVFVSASPNAEGEVIQELPVVLFGSDPNRIMAGDWLGWESYSEEQVANLANPVEMAYAISTGIGSGYMPAEWIPCELAGNLPILEQNTGKLVKVTAFRRSPDVE
jgi:DNA-binding transcriptional LysR family regulator